MTTVSVRWGRAFPSVHSICSCLHFRFCLWNKFLPLERRIPWWRDLWDQAPFLCSLDLAAMNTHAWIYSPAMKWNIKLMHSHFQVFTCEFIAVIARDFRISRAFWFDRILFTFFSWGFNFFCLPAGLIFCIKVLQHTDGWSWIPWLWYHFLNQDIIIIYNVSNVVNQNLLDCDPAKSVEDTGEKGDEENHLSKYLRYVAEVVVLPI